ncbi:MAG: DUF3427 domain-containing protein [Kineosporiaceae bacterium]
MLDDLDREHTVHGRTRNLVVAATGTVTTMRALGFVSTVAHAHFLARQFTAAGIRAVALDASSNSQHRQATLRALRDGDVKLVVSVDLFNEGVDVPDVDTILMLRPTESATVFLQQLGRGLRRSPGKSVLTVLDFIGHQNKRFRFDLRYRALTGVSRQGLVDAVQHGFAYLPAGTHLQLDRVATEAVLENVRAHVPSTTAKLVDDVREHARLRSTQEYALADYLHDAVAEPADIYGRTTWTAVCRRAGLRAPAVSTSGPDAAREEADLLRRVRALAHVDDLPRLAVYRQLVTDPASFDLDDVPQRRLATMLYFTLWPDGRDASPTVGLARRLLPHPAVVAELLQLWDVAEERIPHVSYPLVQPDLAGVPLRVHARYTREEMLAGLGWAHLDPAGPRVPRGHATGTRQLPELNADAFDITWRKTESGYSPSTMYRDYAISPTRIHWESPASLRTDSPAAVRYRTHAAHGRHVLLFAREAKTGPLGALPLMFLGTARYVSDRGELPVSFTWDLERPLPAQMLVQSQLLTG